ncbi:hypothetical protein EAF04_003836 [Stromatinia cepivora]|nr:hypothetical protein EAF04_003836 [Stromatinia cepivora]
MAFKERLRFGIPDAVEDCGEDCGNALSGDVGVADGEADCSFEAVEAGESEFGVVIMIDLQVPQVQVLCIRFANMQQKQSGIISSLYTHFKSLFFAGNSTIMPLFHVSCGLETHLKCCLEEVLRRKALNVSAWTF